MDEEGDDLVVRSMDETALGQVFTRLEEVKVDILRQVSTRLEYMENRLSGKIDSVQSDVQRISSRGRISGRGSSRGSPVHELEVTQRFALPDVCDVQDLDLVAARDDAWLHSLRITMMYTIIRSQSSALV